MEQTAKNNSQKTIVRAKVGVEIRNTFDFELKNTMTGEVKHYKSHNIVLDTFINALVTAASILQITTIYIGTGTGTLSPARTSLFNQLGSFQTGNPVSSNTSSTPAVVVYSITLNETQGNGSLTEVGLVSASSGLLTHSLITDSENNPITITKTNLDILTIRATLYASFVVGDSPDFIMPRFPGMAAVVPQDAPVAIMENARILTPALGLASPFNPSSIRFLGTYKKGRHLDISYAVTTPHARSFVTDVAGTVSRIAGERRVRTSATVAAGSANFGDAYLIKAIRIAGYGEIQFPNPRLFPRKSLELTVGVGDGITTDFNLPFPQCNTGDEEIYVDGILQPRGTYDFNGKNMTFSQAWRSMDVEYLMDGSGFARTTTGSYWPFFPSGVVAANQTHFAADAGNPYVYDFGEPVKVNRVQGSLASNLEYSHDNVTWTRVITNQTNVSFDIVEARYWRFWPTSHPSSSNVSPSPTSMLFAFDELRDGLIFDVPPPEDAVITAKVTSDYPWKNANWQLGVVVDFYINRA